MGFVQVENHNDEQKDALKNKLNLKGDQIGSEKQLWMTVKSFHVRRNFNDFNARSVQTSKAVYMMVFFISLNATLKDTLMVENIIATK